MEATKPQATTPRAPSYAEFEPFCQWQREESRDVLVIHLQDFKKEQLRVQVNSRGILKISGERSIDSWKKSKFYKEVEVPKNCNTNVIQAKFANGCLYVIMPKTTNIQPPTEQQTNNKPHEVAAESSADHTKKPESDHQEKGVFDAAALLAENKEVASPKVDESGKGEKPTKCLTKPGSCSSSSSSGSRIKRCAKTSFNVVVGLAVMGALSAYVFYMYKSILIED